MPSAVMDIECFRNYFLVMFKRLSDNRTVSFEQYEGKDLDVNGILQVLHKYEVITFNGNKYDIPILRIALAGANCATLKLATDDIIVHSFFARDLQKNYKMHQGRINHVDIKELCVGHNALKLYGARLHVPKLQDLPFDPNNDIKPAERNTVKIYCGNDLDITHRIFTEIEPQVKLRRKMSSEYGLDLRSRSDAQIAESVLKSKLGRDLKAPSLTNTCFKYDLPGFLEPLKHHTCFKHVLEIVSDKAFNVNAATGAISMPPELQTLKLRLGHSTYQLGMGGLHSTESKVWHIADDQILLADWDVTSYYPSIILNCCLYPEQLGVKFLGIYNEIVQERISAKMRHDDITADTLKIVINGSFGKLGSQYSVLYSPKLMVQVTVTGQLSLLLLIKMLEDHGLNVVSANTDGIVIKGRRSHENIMCEIIRQWEQITGFKMERSDFIKLYSRDINNYFALKPNGKIKAKGCFSEASLKKNPQAEICYQAVIQQCLFDTPIENFIIDCQDITKFLVVRTVSGGAIKNGNYLGKVIRWYYAKGERGVINYKSNNNTVGSSLGGQPLMELPDKLPQNIDYQWYIHHAKELMSDIGKPLIGQMNLF